MSEIFLLTKGFWRFERLCDSDPTAFLRGCVTLILQLSCSDCLQLMFTLLRFRDISVVGRDVRKARIVQNERLPAAVSDGKLSDICYLFSVCPLMHRSSDSEQPDEIQLKSFQLN